ncbi:SubName: Full=Uncharacterized protein {ECO:0000313/EMBL:CCA76180.1} [Serendipita indica DSM 11827]|uniref:Uncharacterized protein n=1 Tax=Serendipita indica (strain DSM 11827) TaxID=1109443 RepID=G4TXY7_SERID|nr:SubName: Full=Uncharacterized protein {ECO:0000313/EMBL:CCA76180.1} [Serendipita indica DSM 11827]CCA76180.1 hypothetical protein PIIN_10173 [Serendipita indica DSM 11827]
MVASCSGRALDAYFLPSDDILSDLELPPANSSYWNTYQNSQWMATISSQLYPQSSYYTTVSQYAPSSAYTDSLKTNSSAYLYHPSGSAIRPLPPSVAPTRVRPARTTNANTVALGPSTAAIQPHLTGATTSSAVGRNPVQPTAASPPTARIKAQPVPVYPQLASWAAQIDAKSLRNLKES